MISGINTLDDFDVRGKTVICRVDLNQPVDRDTGKLMDITRIKACVPTIEELSNGGAKVVLLAHQGSDIEYKNFYTLRPHAKVLTELLGKDVMFLEDLWGPAALDRIRSLEEGQILLLENVRFASEEQTLFEKNLRLTPEQQAQTLIVRKLAPLADLYICDAFAAAHRNQPSLCGFEQVLPSAMGRLFEKEYSILSSLMDDPKHPCTFVLGGAKVADAFIMMGRVLEKGVADNILTGGLVANILLASQGFPIGNGSLKFIEDSGYGEYIDKSKEIYAKYSERIYLPHDLAYVEDNSRVDTPLDKVPQDITSVDIGVRTATEYQRIIKESETVFVNGPMGVFEEDVSGTGTEMVWDAIADTDGFTVIGGGDSITATKKYGKTDDISYICTGGGALIRFLSGKELPVITALKQAAKYRKEQ
ncbi:MAG: phosphoglycerate kinase [Anaerovoracaceae bacterium]|jgi:phosphoglycerate kinase